MAPQDVVDPAVCVGVVADVVQRHVRPARQPLGSPGHDRDLDPFFERRQQQGAVVGDTRALGRKRAEVGDLHGLSSRSMTWSHVTRSATCLPERPQARALFGFAASQAHASATAAGLGSQTKPFWRSTTTSRGPPASTVVTTGFSERNASYGTNP